MRRPACALLCLLALPAFAADERTLQGTAVLGADDRVRVEFPVGELTVEAVEGDRFTIVIEAWCKRDRSSCRRQLDEISIDVTERRGTFHVDVAPHSKWRSWNALQLEAEIRHPADREIEIDMGVGEITIDGLRGDLMVDLGVGEVTVDLPLAAVRSVHLDAGVGETELLAPDGWVQGDRSFLVGSESSWSGGPGQARVRVDVGVGEAVVRLED